MYAIRSYYVKDNHRRIWGRDGDRSLADAVRAAREKTPGVLIEIEVENERELEDALTGQPDWVLLDNMTPEVLKACVSLCDRRARLEASGGIRITSYNVCYTKLLRHPPRKPQSPPHYLV